MFVGASWKAHKWRYWVKLLVPRCENGSRGCRIARHGDCQLSGYAAKTSTDALLETHLRGVGDGIAKTAGF